MALGDLGRNCGGPPPHSGLKGRGWVTHTGTGRSPCAAGVRTPDRAVGRTMRSTRGSPSGEIGGYGGAGQPKMVREGGLARSGAALGKNPAGLKIWIDADKSKGLHGASGLCQAALASLKPAGEIWSASINCFRAHMPSWRRSEASAASGAASWRWVSCPEHRFASSDGSRSVDSSNSRSAAAT